MERLDELLNFLFRTIKGRLVLIGCTIFIACMCSGCFLFDCPSCMCASCGCDTCANCWEGCDQTCNKNCGGCADNDCGGCVFGDGCEKDCGGCYVDCGGCNRTCVTECNTGCGGDNANVNCQAGNCTVYGEDPSEYNKTIYYNVYFRFFDSDGNRIDENDLYLGSGGGGLRGTFKRGEIDSITQLVAPDLADYFESEGLYADSDLTQRIGDGAGNLDKGVKVKSENDASYYYKLIENDTVGNKYTVRLYDQDRKLIKTMDAYVGTVLNGFPTDESMDNVDGYKFIGWTKNPDWETIRYTAVANGKPFHAMAYNIYNSFDLNLYAVYEPITCNVTVNIEGYETVTREVAYDANLSEALKGLTVVKPNALFAGWAFSYEKYQAGAFDVRSGEIQNYTVKSDLVLYAVFRDKVTVTFHYVGGPNDKNTESKEAYVGDTIDFPVTTQQIGVNAFAGWYDNDKFETGAVYGSYINVTKDTVHYYARWVMETEYKITYMILRDIVYRMHQAEDYVYDETHTTSLMELDMYIPTGYRFVGWTRNESDDYTKAFTELPAGTTGNITLYAKYEPITYNLLLDAKGGSISSLHYNDAQGSYEHSVKYDFEGSIPTPVREGYDFGGWFVLSDDSPFANSVGRLYSKFTYTDDLRLYAKWTIKSYQLTFKSKNVELTRWTITYREKPGATPQDPTPTKGYHFVGWFDSDGNEYDANKPIVADITYNAEFAANTYTVTLQLSDGATFEDGTTQKKVEVKYDQRGLTLKYIPKRDGYRFDGWQRELANGDSVKITNYNGVLTASGKDYDPFILDYNVTLTAIWLSTTN